MTCPPKTYEGGMGGLIPGGGIPGWAWPGDPQKKLFMKRFSSKSESDPIILFFCNGDKSALLGS